MPIMAQFAYKAIDRKGKKVTGSILANNIEDLEFRLSKYGQELISAKPQKKRSRLFSRSSIDRRALIVFFIDLEQMAGAGIAIIDSLIEMRDSASSPAMLEMTAGLVEAISSGKSLSEAMEEYPRIFNQITIKLIIAGEHTGNMVHIFGELKDTLRWQDDVISKTKKLMMYPLFVGVIVFAVICFLMIYLVPKLISFILSMGQEVPLITQVLIYVSEIFVNYWGVIVLAPPVLLFVGREILKRNARAQYLFDEYQLKVPLLGEALKKIMLSRFTRNFALLYDAGISVLDCLDVSEKTVTNTYLAGELAYTRQQIQEGASINEAFTKAELFPALVLRMIQVGEMTGGLGNSLANVSDFYTRDVNDLIDKLQSMIEPFMTVFMGLLLGWIMLAVLGPIYDIIGTIQF
ncbi:MAG: type II secretion system F family protein [Porticoccaceae bacterium]|nr:type II secretion system F family protein [Porticoccaceae bacterium]